MLCRIISRIKHVYSGFFIVTIRAVFFLDKISHMSPILNVKVWLFLASAIKVERTNTPHAAKLRF
ncbi:hypothetical protein BABINDRAFT_162254 [Babjeviella inositovora NRRL Y-12698]|uniref:Uncharacterized protein n=1 Tax=Babjeviella inositovora NRRL Y-12698 TaxID=984486 RepID=A0A1E3QP35_9ASCO|nr:uncharacterized protein BABINDRAFT_162254 [Babjeviella inositovora NRRL Y-12698]ODQ79214.1 hypothetical protein BABINDRAFT_162254 [Babjeviella inositovora NRRL Y-12698]